MAGHGAPGAALSSNLVFRILVGSIAAAVWYAAVGALYLAWHQRLFRRFGAAGANVEPPAQETAEEISARDHEIHEFMATTTRVVEDLSAQVKEVKAHMANFRGVEDREAG
jgi:hypothetical protein